MEEGLRGKTKISTKLVEQIETKIHEEMAAANWPSGSRCSAGSRCSPRSRCSAGSRGLQQVLVIHFVLTLELVLDLQHVLGLARGGDSQRSIDLSTTTEAMAQLKQFVALLL